MHSIMRRIAFTLLLVFEVQGDRYTTHYAERNCDRFKSDEVKYSLASYGQSSSAIIKATNSLSYSYPFNCNITVSVRNNDDAHVLLRVRKISFPKTDCKNYVKIYESKKTYQLCYKDDVGATDFTRRDSNQMKFLYHTEYDNGRISGSDDEFFKSGFEILATAYTLAPCGWDLSFLCNNGRCISKKLVRDGYDNCGDNSDEENKYRISIRLPVRTVVGIIIGVLLLIAAISGAIWLFRRKRVTTTRTYTTPTQPLYPAGAGSQPYPQAPAPAPNAPYPSSPVPYAPYPSVPGHENPYGGETYQKSAPYPQHGGMVNPNYGQPPPPYQ